MKFKKADFLKNGKLLRTFPIGFDCQCADNAGEQVVKECKIDREFMEAVSDVEITQKKFQEQADYFWESLNGKASYLKSSFRM